MNYVPPTHAVLFLEGGTYKTQTFRSGTMAEHWLRECGEDGTYALVNLSTGLATTFVVATERVVRQVTA